MTSNEIGATGAAAKRWLAPLLLALGLAGALSLPASAQAQGTPEAPLITLSKPSNETLEGGNALFFLTASFPIIGQGQNNDISVHIEVTVEGITVTPASYTNPTVISFPDGATRVTLSIPTNDDTDLEAAGSRIAVKIQEDPEDIDKWTVGADVDVATLRCTVPSGRAVCMNYVDNEPIVTATDASASEGNDLVWVVSFNRAASPPRDILINYATSEAGTSTSATQNVDYTHTTGVLTFGTGETRKEVRVTALDDTVAEGDEQLFLNIDSTTFDHTISGDDTSNAGLIRDQGLPVVRAAQAAPVREGEDAVFQVTTRPTTFTLVVDWSTQDGTALAGSDYETANGTLTLGGADRVERVEVRVPTIADDITENTDETFALNLVMDSASANFAGTPVNGTGVINADIRGLTDQETRDMNEAMLPYLALAIAGEAADAVQTRMNAIFDGVNREGLSLQGQGFTDFLASQARLHPAEQGQPGQPSFAPTEFTYGLTTSERIGGDGDRQVTLWGRGFQHALEVEDGVYPFDGEVTGGMVGLDVPGLKPGLIVGLGVSHASSELKFTDTLSGAGLAGVHKTDLRGLHPYFGWQVSEEGNVWGLLGVAKGELEILVENRLPHAEDFELKTLNFGGYNRFRERETPGGGDISLGLAGDSLYAEVRTEGPGALKASATRLRLGLEVGYDRGLDTGAELGSTLEMNLRHDDGDLLDGFGMELGGGMDFTLPQLGLRFDLKARTLLAHQDDVQEWGVSGSIAWDAGRGGRGLSLALKPHLGMTESLSDDVWRQAAPSYSRQAGAAGRGYELEVKYGLPVLAGRETLTVFARSRAQEADQRLGLGAHFRLGEALSTGYEAVLQTGRPLSSAQKSGHRAYIRYERDL